MWVGGISNGAKLGGAAVLRASPLLSPSNAWKKGDPAKIFWKYTLKTLELLKIHNKSVKISRFSPKYSAIFSFLSQVCCLVTPTFSFVLKIFSKYFGGIALLETPDHNHFYGVIKFMYLTIESQFLKSAIEYALVFNAWKKGNPAKIFWKYF